ncbi:hypothetical protein QZH41_007474 [Actinostola sp. cb2023]|nr:hypothetical protein QZH41_007474 [Actinostola sp. cb2023]
MEATNMIPSSQSLSLSSNSMSTIVAPSIATTSTSTCSSTPPLSPEILAAIRSAATEAAVAAVRASSAAITGPVEPIQVSSGAGIPVLPALAAGNLQSQASSLWSAGGASFGIASLPNTGTQGRSAPFIFNSVATMVEWILINNHSVSDIVHYLDDFILAGPPDSSVCAQDLATSLIVCNKLGLPLHPKKCEGPATSLVVLGILLNSEDLTARLPEDKLIALKSLIQSWVPRRWCNRHQLESLIGYLHHAAKVVWPGRSFIRRMIDLLCCFRNKDHPIRLNKEFRQDLLWWHTFLTHWHGVQFWLFPGLSLSTDVEVTADAAGSIGYGAFHGLEWFNGIWSEPQKDMSIAYKELFPIVIAADLWGAKWVKLHVLFRSDNEAVDVILNSRTSRVPCIMHLVRHLLSSAACYNFTFAAQHIPGIQNSVADALSRFNWQEFRQLAPMANPHPVPIPKALLWELTSPLSNSGAKSTYDRA